MTDNCAEEKRKTNNNNNNNTSSSSSSSILILIIFKSEKNYRVRVKENGIYNLRENYGDGRGKYIKHEMFCEKKKKEKKEKKGTNVGVFSAHRSVRYCIYLCILCILEEPYFGSETEPVPSVFHSIPGDYISSQCYCKILLLLRTRQLSD